MGSDVTKALVTLAGAVERGDNVPNWATGVESLPALRQASYVAHIRLVVGYHEARFGCLAIAEPLNLLTQPIFGRAHLSDGRCICGVWNGGRWRVHRSSCDAGTWT